MQQLAFADDSQEPTQLKIGDLLCWHDPEEDEVVLCFKLDPAGQWNYGEFIVMRNEFEWDDFVPHPTIALTDDELAASDMRIGNDFTFSSAEITVEDFSDSEDIVRATITGIVVDEDEQTHDFRLSSLFHIVRRQKDAAHWQQRLTESMVDRFPSFQTVRHYTEQSDYGLRYGDVYFSEFKTSYDEPILIQLVFDSSATCELYVARPDDPTIDYDDRTFPATESGLKRMTAYIKHEFTKR